MKVQAKKKVTSEKKIQNEILEWLVSEGILCWQNKSVGLFDARIGKFRRKAKYEMLGISDILGVLPNGRFLAIEVKRPGGKVSDYQEAFIIAVNGDNGLGMIAYSLEDVKEALKSYYAPDTEQVEEKPVTGFRVPKVMKR